jgi:Secretion system C-terminal sorting domain
MQHRILLILIFILGNTCSNAQVFSKFYDYNGINDLGTDVICLNDGYLFVSPSADLKKIDTFTYAQTFQLFFRTNKQGEVIKSKPLRIPVNYLDNNGRSLLQLTDTTFLNSGIKFDLVKYKNDSIGSDVHLIKFNLSLDTILTKTISVGLGNEATVDVLKSSDGNIMIFGQNCTQGIPIKDCNYFLMKLDTNLNVLWSHSYTYDTMYWENPTSFVETADKGFLLFGHTNAFIFEPLRYWYLVKTDSLGIKQWQKIYMKNKSQFGFSISSTLDKNYLIAGSVETIITGGVKENQGWLMKIDPLGNTLWETIFGSDREDYFYKVLENADSTIIVAGHQLSERLSVNDVDGWLLKFDKKGKLLWERVYNNYSSLRHQHPDDLVYSMRITEDKGFVMVGWSRNPALQNPTQDIWLLKVDSFGCLVPGCQGVGIDGKRISTEEVLIYPNPAQQHIKLKHREAINYYKIIDALGKTIQDGKYNAEGIQLLSEISPGTYLIYTQFESGTQGFGKLLVER